MFRRFLAAALVALLLIAVGCGQVPQPPPPLSSAAEDKPICIDPEESEAWPAGSLPAERIEMSSSIEAEASPDGQPKSPKAAVNRDMCYRLQPGRVKIAAVKKSKKSSRSIGCCQPQSLIYARCRSGLDTCRLGDTSPVQWFACASKQGNTAILPREGAIMVLDGNARRRMPTGHPVYVEAARPSGNGTWILRISHTNYDRLCHLDQDAEVHYDPERRIASFQSGAWGNWAHDLKVLGFILR